MSENTATFSCRYCGGRIKCDELEQHEKQCSAQKESVKMLSSGEPGDESEDSLKRTLSKETVEHESLKAPDVESVSTNKDKVVREDNQEVLNKVNMDDKAMLEAKNQKENVENNSLKPTMAKEEEMANSGATEKEMLKAEESLPEKPKGGKLTSTKAAEDEKETSGLKKGENLNAETNNITKSNDFGDSLSPVSGSGSGDVNTQGSVNTAFGVKLRAITEILSVEAFPTSRVDELMLRVNQITHLEVVKVEDEDLETAEQIKKRKLADKKKTNDSGEDPHSSKKRPKYESMYI